MTGLILLSVAVGVEDMAMMASGAINPATVGLDAGFVAGTNGIVTYLKEWIYDILPDHLDRKADRYLFFLPFLVGIVLAYLDQQVIGPAFITGMKYGLWATVLFRGYKVQVEGK